MNNIDIGIRTHDIQTGLYKFQGPIIDLHLNQTLKIGKAASLASHMRGVHVIENKNALIVMASKLGISGIELEAILEILNDIGYIRIVGNKTSFDKIEVLIDNFEDVYSNLGELWRNSNPTEFENKTLNIVNELAGNILYVDSAKEKYDLSVDEFEVLSTIGTNGGFIDSYKSKGNQMLFSPIYMDENPKKVISFLSNYENHVVNQAFQLLNSKPGYPIKDLNSINNDVILGMMSKNIIHTPAINASGGTVNFVFSPFDNTGDKQMLRHARLLISAIRYGEKFSNISTLKYPKLFLESLLDNKYIGKSPHQDILPQYAPLRDCGLGRIEEIGSNRYRFYLADTEYAKNVVRLAMKILYSTSENYGDFSRGIIDEAWEQRQNLSSYDFNDYVPELSNAKNINMVLQQKMSMNQSQNINNNINSILNNFFIMDGVSDVF